MTSFLFLKYLFTEDMGMIHPFYRQAIETYHF